MDFKKELRKVFDYALREHETVKLMDWDEDPLGQFIKDVEELLNEAKEIKTHKHSWNENNYCSVCGVDGQS